MKKAAMYFVIALMVAFVGILISDVLGNLFNGMDYGSACAVGMGAYLCAVVVVCTGIIISKIEDNPNKSSDNEKQ